MEGLEKIAVKKDNKKLEIKEIPIKKIKITPKFKVS